MNHHLANFQKVLAIYLSRGKQAITALENGEYDEADRLVQLHKAAFFNLRALEFFVPVSSLNDDMLETWKEAISVNDCLESCLYENRKQLNHQLHSLREAQRMIPKFKSSISTLSRGFQRGV